MARGDQLYVMRPFMGLNHAYQHHGIDCGDGTVVHYYKGSGEPVIQRTTFETFARGNPVYTKPQPVSYIPERVIERAESRIGEREYNLLTNNCEHFATWCKTGRNESQQLLDYGVDVTQINPLDSRRLIEASLQGSDPATAMREFKLALDRVAIAQTQLQPQLNQAQQEMNTWHRVAQLALKQGKENLARAALERKVKFKKQVADLQKQLTELREMQETLDRNSQVLQQRTAMQLSSQ